MTREFGSMRNQTGAGIYYIRVKGYLDESWSAWLGDLAITHAPDGTSLLAGPVADQAALLGLLCRLHGLGLTLLSVTCSVNPLYNQQLKQEGDHNE